MRRHLQGLMDMDDRSRAAGDRCVVLNFGRKIAEGRYRDIAADAQVQEAYLGVA